MAPSNNTTTTSAPPERDEPLLEIRDLKRSYVAPDGGVTQVLDVAELDVAEGEQVALAGTSGSGKTTLLNVIAGILRPDSGTVRVAGVELGSMSEAQRDAFRARTMGYVFQSFHLLEGYTALENVLLGMVFGAGVDEAHARELLGRLGLGERLDHRPSQLSIGQRQRVALARALANRPRLVLADEPTGNLDPASTREALGVIRELCGEVGAGLLIVSHDPAVLAVFDRRLELAHINRAAAQVSGAAEGDSR